MKASDKPYADNYPPLRDWLRKHEARCMWQQRIGGTYDEPSGYVECWLVGSRECIVTVQARKMGWNIYTACSSPHTVETLADAEARLLGASRVPS